MLDTIHDELINELVEKSESIFTVDYLMDDFAIFNVSTAKEIIQVFNEVFGDINEVELILYKVQMVTVTTKMMTHCTKMWNTRIACLET